MKGNRLKRDRPLVERGVLQGFFQRRHTETSPSIKFHTHLLHEATTIQSCIYAIVIETLLHILYLVLVVSLPNNHYFQADLSQIL